MTFGAIAPIGALSRVDATANATNQAGDHNEFQQKIDALIAAGATLDDALTQAIDAQAGVTNSLQTAITALQNNATLATLGEPYAGMQVPGGSLEHIFYNADGPRRGLFMGDSTIQQTTGSCSFGQGGKGTIAERLSVSLARSGWGPCISPGLRPMWYSGAAWTFGSGYVEYTIVTGTPTGYNPTRAGIDDVAPFGRAVLLSHVTDVVRWTKPTLGPSLWWGRPIVGFELVYLDASAIATGGMSFSIDGGAYQGSGQPTIGDGKLKTVYIAQSVSSTISIRGANAQGNGINTILVGIRPYWAHPYTGIVGTDGFYIDNLGHDSNLLSSFVNSASSGDPLAILNNVVNPLGTRGLAVPPAFGFASFTNDEAFAYSSTWTNNLSAILARLRAGGGDMIHMSCYEQTSRGASDVLTDYGDGYPPQFSNQKAYRDGSTAWAALNNVAYLNLYKAWAARGYAGAAQASPYLLNISLHPTQEGINDETTRVKRMLTTFA